MTESPSGGHKAGIVGHAPLSRLAVAAPLRDESRGSGASLVVPFEALYNDYFDFVWRSVLRLGVPEANADDAAQDVFVVVHRRLGEFAGRSSIKTWVFGIATNVARDYRRALRRKGGHEPLDEGHVDPRPGPGERADQADTARLLTRALDALDDEKRAVFVSAELEEMTAPEIAEAMGINLNTVYSRLRVARQIFQRALSEARGGGR